MGESGPDLGPREAFVERFALPYAEAGEPPLRRVTAEIGRIGLTDESGRPVRVTVARVSDWRRGRNMPARFAALAAVLEVLIEHARKVRPRPCLEGLYDVDTWHTLWEQALAGPESGETRETGVCPYKGLAAFDEEDTDWFFGRGRSTEALGPQR